MAASSAAAGRRRRELIAAATVHAIREHGPDRVGGFTPIPAMSPVSFAAGSRFLSLIGGHTTTFYDWYADLPPASPQVFGDQTDVPESADWWDASYLIVWGTNLPITRTPDAHFMTEARYRGQKVVVVSPDYSDHVKFADDWLPAQPGTDAALAMAMGHVMLKEIWVDRPVARFQDYGKRFTDLPLLVTLEERDGVHVPGRFVTAADLGEAQRERRLEAGRARRRDGGAGGPQRQRSASATATRARGAGTCGSATLDPVLTLHGRHERAVEVALPRFDVGDGPGGGVDAPRRARRARRGPARDDGARPDARHLRRRPRGPARRLAGGLRRRHAAVHAGVAGGDHRRRPAGSRSRSRASSPATPRSAAGAR